MSKIRLGPKPFLLPQPAVLVGTLVDGRPNYMMAAWCGMANHAPPMLTVAVRPSRHTEAGIRQNQVFSVNIPPAGLVEKADCCGIVSGAQMDKGELFSIHYGVLGAAPLIEECRLGLECRLDRGGARRPRLPGGRRPGPGAGRSPALLHHGRLLLEGGREGGQGFRSGPSAQEDVKHRPGR
jgi:hypothetical protein